MELLNHDILIHIFNYLDDLSYFYLSCVLIHKNKRISKYNKDRIFKINKNIKKIILDKYPYIKNYQIILSLVILYIIILNCNLLMNMI